MLPSLFPLPPTTYCWPQSPTHGPPFARYSLNTSVGTGKTGEMLALWTSIATSLVQELQEAWPQKASKTGFCITYSWAFPLNLGLLICQIRVTAVATPTFQG